MNVLPVKTSADHQAFIHFPYQHYRSDSAWIPPLRDEVRKEFDPHHNPFLDHCDWQLFLLRDGNTIMGRIAAFIDTLAVDFWRERIGLFGYYECVENPDAARLLLSTACDWLQGRGCTKMRGPWSFVSQEWGMVVEGFEPSPVIMAPYNPPRYNEDMTNFGLLKAKDLLCWYISIAEGYTIPERIIRRTDRVADRWGIHIRQIDMRRYDQEVQTLIELSNNSIINNWGYSPVTEAEAQAMARDLKAVIQPKGVLFAEDSAGKTIGFAIALPDINRLLKGLNGRLFPIGFVKLLYGIPRLRNYRLFALGVIPEFHGKAVDSLLYRALNESLASPETWVEINYVLEDNWPMVNAIKKLGATPLRRYRVYEKEIGA